jgi:putative membrane protein
MIMKANKAIIIIISVLVPMLVAFLFVNTEEQALVSGWIYRLPHLNALINGSTAIILMLGVWLIKNGNEKWHRVAMLTAFVLGAVFLVSYIIYHSSVPSTVFGDINHDNELDVSELAMLGNMRLIYLILLLAHILMAIVALPFVLLAVYYAIIDNRTKHRKIVRYTFPVWLFVAISGVLVYFMISPYY